MKLYDLIKDYGKDKGKEVMWKSVRILSEYLEKNKDKLDNYNGLMKCVYGIMSGNHYEEEYAREDVSKLRYTDSNGVPHYGAHWTLDQVVDAWREREFKESVTDADKWVAANVAYSDLCRKFDDTQILDIAYLFFFDDEDYEGDDKIWRYMAS